MPYTIMLAQFRRCLVLVAGLQREVAWTFSLYSLKCTLLSWALRCKVDPVERAAQGHHRHHGFSQCVQRYSRDDVTPQLNCQRALLKVLDSGWRPGVPLQRGVGCLVHERAGQESDTESDSSGSSSSSRSFVTPPSQPLVLPSATSSMGGYDVLVSAGVVQQSQHVAAIHL